MPRSLPAASGRALVLAALVAGPLAAQSTPGLTVSAGVGLAARQVRDAVVGGMLGALQGAAQMRATPRVGVRLEGLVLPLLEHRSVEIPGCVAEGPCPTYGSPALIGAAIASGVLAPRDRAAWRPSYLIGLGVYRTFGGEGTGQDASAGGSAGVRVPLRAGARAPAVEARYHWMFTILDRTRALLPVTLSFTF